MSRPRYRAPRPPRCTVCLAEMTEVPRYGRKSTDGSWYEYVCTEPDCRGPYGLVYQAPIVENQLGLFDRMDKWLSLPAGARHAALAVLAGALLYFGIWAAASFVQPRWIQPARLDGSGLSHGPVWWDDDRHCSVRAYWIYVDLDQVGGLQPDDGDMFYQTGSGRLFCYLEGGWQNCRTVDFTVEETAE